MAKSTQGEVVYEVRVDDSHIEADMDQANEKIIKKAEKTSGEIIEIAKETKKGIKKQTKKILENAEEKADKVAEAWKEASEEIEKSAEDVSDAWEESVEEVEKAMDNISESECKIKVDSSEAEEEVKTLADNIKNTFSEAVSEKIPLAGTISDLTEGLPSVKENVLGVATAIATESVAIAGEMQDAMNSFLFSTGKSTEEAERYQQVLENIYQNNYGESFEDIAESMSEITRTMGDMDDSSLQEMTESAITLRDVFGFDIAETAETAKNLMDEYGMSGEEAMNLIATGAQSGLESSEELFAAMSEGLSTTGGELDAIKENQGNSLSSMFEELKRNVDLLIAPIGAELIPLLVTLIEAVLPVVQELLVPLIELFAMLLEPIIDLIGTAITPLIEIFMLLMDKAIKPLIDIVQNLLVPIFEESLQGLASSISKVVGNIKNIFTNIIDFIKNVITGNWKGAWENIKNIFANIVDGLGELFKMPINFIIDAINGFISGINKIKIPDWIPKIGGKGFNIPKIPRLKVGLDYVPSDFFPAFLDEGEAVLTKEENAIFRSLGGLEGMISLSRNQYPELLCLSSEPMSIVVHSHVELDGKEVGNSVTRYVDMNLSENEYLRRRGN